MVEKSGVDASNAAATIALGILSLLAINGLLNSGTEKPQVTSQQPEDRLRRGKALGLTPQELDKTDMMGRTGYVPQNRMAILEAIASLPRPSRQEYLDKVMSK